MKLTNRQEVPRKVYLKNSQINYLQRLNMIPRPHRTACESLVDVLYRESFVAIVLELGRTNNDRAGSVNGFSGTVYCNMSWDHSAALRHTSSLQSAVLNINIGIPPYLKSSNYIASCPLLILPSSMQHNAPCILKYNPS